MDDLLTAAARFINTTSSHIFLTGKAGTGKTTFLRNIGEITHKNYIVVAPTGIAALNAGGVTIHSQFLLPPVTFLPDRSLPDDITDNGRVLNQHVLARKHPLNSARKKVLRSIDLLVIDEVSMLRADLLDAIDYRMKAARGNFKQSFGGVQVLFIGDLYQLPPVVRNEEQEILSRYYSSAWFYEAKALQNDPLVYIELDKIFRQHDQDFIDILNNLRNNTVSDQDIETLNRHYKSESEINQLKEVITLTTHNYKADELNQKELRNLDTPSHLFDAHLEGDFPESMYPVISQLELKEGAQIMFIRNDAKEEKKYFNGKLATVKKISDDGIIVEMAGNHEEYSLETVRWENKRYTVESETHDLSEEVIGAFEQYPVKLAWAITVHKSQGLTFDSAIIDVGQAFADGQVYVALSRLRTLDGLVLRTRIHSAAISTDKHVAAFAQANHHPHLLNDVMKTKQRIFLRQQLENTFDFSSLLREIQYVQKDQEAESFKEETMKPVLTQIAESLDSQRSNTETFRRQLGELLQSNNQSQLIDRIAKGREYYRSFLFNLMRMLLVHLEAMKQQKRVKTYVTELGELDQALNKKLEEVDITVLLTDGILQGQSQFDFSGLTSQRVNERAAILAEIQKSQADHSSRARKRKKERKSKIKDGISTFDITLGMFNKGMTIDQIAKERELVPSTIEGHLGKAIEAKRLGISALVNEEELKEISGVIEHLPTGFISKDLYDGLRGKYGYGKLRAVMSHLKLQQDAVNAREESSNGG
jgi:hypothetical protein